MKLKFLFLFLVFGTFVSCQSDDTISSSGYSERLGFYDYDMSGNYRDTGNNLSSGTLTGRVQFGQTHTVEPNGNDKLYLPDVISERDALLIFMPTDDIASSIDDIYVDIVFNGTVQTTLKLNKPKDIPITDNHIKLEHEVVYSTKAWTNEISWKYMKKGLELRFVSNKGSSVEREGILVSSDIEFGTPAVGVFTFIRLGMLTEYRKHGNGYMLDSPAKAMADYFQTAPFAQIVNAKYDNMTLRKVMIGSGTIYDLDSPIQKDRFSRSGGGIYSGDMRENVGKSQISVGINLANFGYPSWDMTQSYPYHHYYMTTHLAQGRYQNTDKDGNLIPFPDGNNWDYEDYSRVVAHGLSGGNGIGTLIDTTGNEFSHEVGHAYGLGHYIRPEGKPDFWTHHHADSGWGYDAYHKMMKSNLIWEKQQVNPINNFIGKYNYTPDTMSGGFPYSKISSYTRLTGYSAMKSQQYLAHRRPMIVDRTLSSTGFLKWDSDKREMVEYPTPIWSTIYNTTNNEAFKPYKIGVPVITIIGAYMPDSSSINASSGAVLYPAFRGNYGNVYNLPAPKYGEKSCWVEVTYNGNRREDIGIAPTRHNSGIPANQIHINIEVARNPTKATVYCMEDGRNRFQLGNSINIDFRNSPPLDPPVIIGKGEGYKAAILEDIKWLNEVLPKYDNIALFIPSLTDAESSAIIRAKSMLNSLNVSAKKVAEQHIKLLNERDIVVDYVQSNELKLLSKDKETVDELLNVLVQNGFIQSGSVPTIDNNYITKFKESGNRCIDAEFSDTVPNCEDNKSSQEWVVDGVGKIHSAEFPNICLYNGGSYLNVTDCDDIILSSQHWVFDGNNQVENKYLIRFKAKTSRCIDYAYHYPAFIPYNCHGGGNQIFEIIAKSGIVGWNDKLFSIISGKELKIIYDIFE